jgi:hypothetical protein
MLALRVAPAAQNGSQVLPVPVPMPFASLRPQCFQFKCSTYSPASPQAKMMRPGLKLWPWQFALMTVGGWPPLA